MPDVSKVLEALECHFKPIGEENCSECAYECSKASWTKIQDDLAKDIMELLKKQQPVEPKVLTKADFAENPQCDRNGNLPVWIERRTGYCGWTVTSAETMYTCMYAHGRQKFRYWTGKPTKEQREATPWEE